MCTMVYNLYSKYCRQLDQYLDSENYWSIFLYLWIQIVTKIVPKCFVQSYANPAACSWLFSKSLLL
jgi:hypothetical protein